MIISARCRHAQELFRLLDANFCTLLCHVKHRARRHALTRSVLPRQPTTNDRRAPPCLVYPPRRSLASRQSQRMTVSAQSLPRCALAPPRRPASADAHRQAVRCHSRLDPHGRRRADLRVCVRIAMGIAPMGFCAIGILPMVLALEAQTTPKLLLTHTLLHPPLHRPPPPRRWPSSDQDVPSAAFSKS